jgi:predicted Fe-Mo cluster-binding NifX family protein
MKIAISSTIGKINEPISERFGRCKYFLIFDSECRKWDTKRNPAESARGGAGSQVVQFLCDNGVRAVISGQFGPNAYTALAAAGMQAYRASSGTPEELVERLLEGELQQVDVGSGSERHY